ncbi:hypothetical protein [Pseudactinotalea sp.]
MVWYVRGLLRLALATTLAVVGLLAAFVLAPAQDSTGVLSVDQSTHLDD